LLFLREVEKAKTYPENLLIVTPLQLLESLNERIA
jgi:hypothetical protein